MESEPEVFDPTAALQEMKRAQELALNHNRKGSLRWFLPTIAALSALMPAVNAISIQWISIVLLIILTLCLGASIGYFEQHRGVRENLLEDFENSHKGIILFLLYMCASGAIMFGLWQLSWWAASISIFIGTYGGGVLAARYFVSKQNKVGALKA